MKTKLLIIIGILIASLTIASVFGYIMYKQNECMSMSGYWHNPRQNDIWDCLQYEGNNTSETQYQIPAHVYEIWQSNGIVIHGTVGEYVNDSSPVSIKIEDEQGGLIEIVQITPDESGRFVHGIVKHDSEIWDNVTSYTVTATYDHPISLEKNDDIPYQTNLDKGIAPLNSEQISLLSHDQTIQVIKEWNKIGGNSPFTVVSAIGVKDNYSLGEPMPFFVQKSGFGNPCHDQGVVIFNEDTQRRTSTGFYLEQCNFEQEDEMMEPFSYLVPYNQDIFAKLAPIMEPGNYVLVAGADENSKYKKIFTVADSDYVYNYNITYELQKDSKDNTKSMTIDLNSGKIIIRDTDGTTLESSIDQDTLHRMNAEIIENGLIVNPWTSHRIGDDCDTCNFGIMKIMIDDVVFHSLVFDDASLSSDARNPVKIGAGSPYFFSLVDCVASKNEFDIFWISDSKNLNNTTSNDCSSIGGERDMKIVPKYGKDDYEFWVNDKPKPGTPPNAGPLAGVHEHVSILVKIFGDKFDFSKSAYQIKNPYIHFEGNDGNTIHRHADNVTLGFLFETMNLKLTEECFVFSDGRSFCSNDKYLLEFYVNGEQVDSVNDFVISQNDRILISYGSENIEGIQEQLGELGLQEIIS